MNKKTVGQILAEHDAQDLPLEDDIRSYSEQAMKEQWKNAQDFAAEGSKRDPYINKNFYIVLFPLNERMMQNKPKYWMGARLSCPSPAYKQIVFKYHYQVGDLEYLWTIPSQKNYMQIWKNRDHYLQSTNQEVKRLAQFVVMDATGALEKWIVKENGNMEDALILMAPRVNNETETARG